jgi:hypothetical protein
MNSSPEKFSLLPAVETASKYIGLSIGAVYLVGFIIVAAHLTRYGVSSFSVLQLQYLIAGVWALGLPGMYFSITYFAADFDERVAPSTPGKINWRRFLISTTISGIPSALFIGLLVSIPTFVNNLTIGLGVRAFGFFIAIMASAGMLLISARVSPEKETILVNRRHAAPFYLVSLLSVLLAYAVWFGVRIYPLIPSSLGGGRPLTIVFIVGEKKLPDEIKEDTKLKRSIPYKLLMETDKFYAVLSPNQGEKSIEVSRDSVSGIIVLEDSHAP